MEHKEVFEKYKDVVEPMSMLQISNNAICEPLIKLMVGREAFNDYDNDIKDVIYSGAVFNDMIDELSRDEIQLPVKYWTHLKEMDILCKAYDYIMVIDNPR